MNKLNEEGIAHYLLLLIVIVAVVGGVGIYVAKNSDKKSNSVKVAQQPIVPLKALPTDISGILTEDKIKQLTETKKPGAVVTQVGLIQGNTDLVFHVELADGTSLNLDAKTGVETDVKEVENDTEGTKIAANFVPTIDFVKAQQIAMTKVPNGIVQRIELDVEDTVTVYNVRFSNGTRVEVNALDGTIVRVKIKGNDSKSNNQKSTDGEKADTNGDSSGSKNNTTTGNTSGSTDSHSGSTSGSTNDITGSSSGTNDGTSGSGRSGGTSGSGSGTSGGH